MQNATFTDFTQVLSKIQLKLTELVYKWYRRDISMLISAHYGLEGWILCCSETGVTFPTGMVSTVQFMGLSDAAPYSWLGSYEKGTRFLLRLHHFFSTQQNFKITIFSFLSWYASDCVRFCLFYCGGGWKHPVITSQQWENTKYPTDFVYSSTISSPNNRFFR